ncbi:MAG: DUF1285 domain-containing protein [Gammaproteobacteria bacterium]|nr:DUF1285 domain-containing protein [Gammaproteobacteria bacterium]
MMTRLPTDLLTDVPADVPAGIPPREPEHLLRALDAVPQPAPVHLWNPPWCGEIDILIARDGRWYHEGRPVLRHTLVQLFSSLLRLEPDGRHVLVTPVEKLGIRVEDCPFVAQLLESEGQGLEQVLRFTLNTGEVVIAGHDHPLMVESLTDEPHPVLMVRDGLRALIARSVFYQLVELAEEQDIEGRSVLVVWSLGSRFELGSLA